MRRPLALALALIALPGSAQSIDTESRVIELAIGSLPRVIHGMKHPDTSALELDAFLLEDLTIGDEHELLDADLWRIPGTTPDDRTRAAEQAP